MERRTKMCKPHDRLSELPDAVIFEIFWLMPMRDVVRTSVLSKRWRNLWTNTPFLDFDNRTMFFDNNRFCKFVNRALLSWSGNRVLKFRLHWCHDKLVSSMFSDVDLWVRFAKRCGVEELYLRMGLLGEEEEVYCVPQCLYSCSSLKGLALVNCSLEIFGNVQWNQLERLKVECLSGFKVTAHVINQILSGTPQLRVFILGYEESGENLSIQSDSLKELFITKFLLGIPVVSELRILTPNLETLELIGFPYSKYLLMNVSSLVRATIRMDIKIWDEDVLFPEMEFMGNALSQILPTIQHVGDVKLLLSCAKALCVMKLKCMHSSFPNVKSLELGCYFDDYEQVVGILEIFPQLERLVIRYQQDDDHQDNNDKEWLKIEPNLSESFLLQLRTVEVTWATGAGDGIFPLIEILLKRASKLEMIVFQLNKKPSPPSDSLYSVSQKLLRMRRSSPNCAIDLTKSYIPF